MTGAATETAGSAGQDRIPTTAATVTPRWEFALRPRQGGKTTLWHETLVRAINVGEHVHNLAVDGTQCWGGDDRCPVWREQGSKDADQPR